MTSFLQAQSGVAGRGPNRRAYRRVRAPVQCRLAGAPSVAQQLESIDISFGGLRIYCQDEYPVGARLRLDIWWPTEAPVAFAAEVIWIAALDRATPAPFEAGLAFVELNTEALKFLMSVLDPEVQWMGSPEAAVGQLRAGGGKSLELVLDEPVSEVRQAAPGAGKNDKAVGADRPTARPCTPPPGPGHDESDRPTARPPVDIQALARQTTKHDSGAPPSDSSGPRTSPPAANDSVEEMRECFSSGDYAGALAIADRILTVQPDNLLARTFRADCCAALEDVYTFRLGPMDRVPRVVRLREPSDSPFADHRTAFLMSFVDGSATLESIVDSCGMPKSDALCILHDLVEREILGFA